MNRLKFVTLLSFTISILIAAFGPERTLDDHKKLPHDWLVSGGQPLTPKEHVRPGDQTYLTYPEWYLVHSPREQAEYFAAKTATDFPYVTHIAQLWRGYGVMNSHVSGNFPFNGGYHLMIWVIAVSTTVEYAIKAFYEKLIGRITDTGQTLTAEDRFNADYMRDYVEFIMQTPWFEYDYFTCLKRLWRDVPYSGAHQLRKWERRFYLTTEFIIKGGYAWLIQKATKSVYEEPILGTAVVVTGGRRTNDPRVKFLKTNADGSATLLLPRYAGFSLAARELALAGATFREIAGNSAALLVTIHSGAVPAFPEEKFRTLFVQPIVTVPGRKRLAVAVKIAHLAEFILRAESGDFRIEHIYDF